MTSCYICKGVVESTSIDHMAHRGTRYVLITDLPVQRCCQCREIYFDLVACEAIDDALRRAGDQSRQMSVPAEPAFMS